MRFRFIASETLSGLRRNLSMVISVVLVTFVSLAFVGAAGLLQQQITVMKGDWYDKVEVSIFLCPSDSAAVSCASGPVTDDQRQAIEDGLNAPDMKQYVQAVHYESKAEAYKSFKKRFGNTEWAASTTEDDMQDSFRVKLVDPQKYQVVTEAFQGEPGVETVVDQRQLLEPLFKVLNRATAFSIAIAGVMLIAAVLLITTTIRLSALSRRRETSIMRLVGASNMFVQLPFMLEGVISATIGAVFAIIALWAGVAYGLNEWLSSTEYAHIDTADVWMLAPWLILAAILLAALSSIFTLKRYTKV